MLAGLMSLWTRPRWCALPRAAAMPMARRRKRPISIGPSMIRSSGSPPGSSSMQRRSTAFAGKLQRPRRPCRRRARPSVHIRARAARGRPGAGAPPRAARPAPRCAPPSLSARHPRQNTRSPSPHRTWRPSSPRGSNESESSNCRAPLGKLSARGQPDQPEYKCQILGRILSPQASSSIAGPGK